MDGGCAATCSVDGGPDERPVLSGLQKARLSLNQHGWTGISDVELYELVGVLVERSSVRVKGAALLPGTGDKLRLFAWRRKYGKNPAWALRFRMERADGVLLAASPRVYVSRLVAREIEIRATRAGLVVLSPAAAEPEGCRW